MTLPQREGAALAALLLAPAESATSAIPGTGPAIAVLPAQALPPADTVPTRAAAGLLPAVSR